MKLTPERLTAFCNALAETCIVGRACDAIGISRVTAYKWREEVPGFKESWDRAKRIGVSALEDEAHRRAFEGVDKPIVYLGQVTGTVKEYSDALTMFLLKAHDPEKYRERSDVKMQGRVDVAAMTDDEIRAELQMLAVAGIIPLPEDCDLA